MDKNFSIEVIYLTDEGKVLFNKRSRGQWKGYRYNGSLRDYFIDYFKKNIDLYEVIDQDLGFSIKVSDLKVKGVKQNYMFKQFSKALKGMAEQFSNEHIKVMYVER